MSKAVKFTVSLMGVLIFLSWISIYSILKVSTAREEGSLETLGLNSKVIVAKDIKGIPRITAQSETDLFFGIGYTHASDRLWQMFTLQQLARGNLAAYFGRKALPIDIYMRAFGLKRLSEKYYSQQTPKMKKLLKSYTAGVNKYIESCSVLPPEFYLAGAKPMTWEPQDSVGVLFVMLLSLSNNLRNEISFLYLAKVALGHGISVQDLAQLYPSQYKQERSAEETSKLSQIDFSRIEIEPRLLNMLNFSSLLEDKGSNSWVVSPSKTKNKKSILANDTHLGIALPPQWYIVNLNSPEYHVMGFTIPGSPLVKIGYNGKIAWGITMLKLDHQDIYLEKLRHEGERSFYLYRGKWLPVSTRQEKFNIKGKESVVKTIKLTRNGPLLNEALSHESKSSLLPASISSEYGIALTNTVAQGDETPTAFYELGKASNIKEAQRALSKLYAGYFNFVITEPENIHWQLSGRIPIRGAGEGYFPSPAWDGKYERRGYVSTFKNPSLSNPVDGFIVTANHRVLDTLIYKDLPYKLTGVWHPIHRYDRIYQILTPASDIDLASARKLQMDEKIIAVRDLQRMLSREENSIRLAIAELSEEDKILTEKTFKILKGFNGDSSKDSKESVLYNLFLDHFMINTFVDEFGPLGSDSWSIFIKSYKSTQIPFQQLVYYTKNSRFFDDIRTSERVETKINMIVLALKDALLDAYSRFSEDENDWNWGELHYYLWEHPIAKSAKWLGFYLNVGPFPAGGDDTTVNVSSSLIGSREYKVYKIPAMRFVFDFSFPNKFYAVLPTGQSGNPASPNYDNMVEDYLNGILYDLPFNGSEADKHYSKKLVLLPVKSLD